MTMSWPPPPHSGGLFALAKVTEGVMGRKERPARGATHPGSDQATDRPGTALPVIARYLAFSLEEVSREGVRHGRLFTHHVFMLL